MTPAIRLGISTCPNDTFAFHGLLTRAVDRRGLEFEIELLDIEELNARMLRGEFDVCKVSFAAALGLAHEVVVLPSGSALGFGVGPLLLAARAGTRDAWTPSKMPAVTSASPTSRFQCRGSPRKATAASADSPGTSAVIMVDRTGP